VIREAARGSREALAKIVAEHYASVYRFCARRLGPEAASDAAQETFVIAQKAIRTFDGRSSLGTFLFGIAHNVCRNAARKRKCEVTYDMAFTDPATDSPEGSLVDREALRTALRKLSHEHREVIVLHELEEMTYDEVAQVLGVPPGTVKSRLYHAFLHLRRAMAEGATS
jgi:RNA polymerase sigma-70 factor (ECF subfamily)